MTVYHTAPQPLSGRSDVEDGPSAKRVYHYVQNNAPNAILGFACDVGVKRNKGRLGAKQGPTAIRRALANLAAPRTLIPFTDLGDIEVEGDDLELGQDTLAQHVSQALLQHNRLIVLGGGHETAYGSYLGIRLAYPEKRIGIINLDAHLDLRNIGENGPSSGTPFNQIRKLDPKGFDYLCLGAAKESNSEALFARAKDWGVNIVFDTDLLADPYCAKAKIDALISRSDIIYLTVDIDLLPHYQAPGVSAPAIRGVAFTTVEFIISQILSACKDFGTPLPLADFVEVSPPHDKDDLTAKCAAILALPLMLSYE